MDENNIKILLAEDDENLGALLREYLIAKGYKTSLFVNGELALEGFKKDKYDICILDVMMPKMDGFTLAREIKKINSTIPFIFLTAKSLKDDVIDMITSDHNPIDIENKDVEFENGMYGTIGLESLFGSLNQVLSLEQTISCLTNRPRIRFNIPINKIKIGEKADLTLFDPDICYVFTKKNILSKSKNSAFVGKNLKGVAHGIIANNKLVLNPTE